MSSYFDGGDESFEEGSIEEGFMRGYEDDDDICECAECGMTFDCEKKVEREIDGETLVFCSQDCANEYEE